MLGNLRISYKLLMIVGLSVLSIAAVAGLGLSALWANLIEDRQHKLHDVVLMARQALDLDYQASRKAGLSDAETIERVKVLVRTLRFGKEDYFYAFDAKGLAVAHANPNVEGKNLYDAADSDGVFFIRRQLEIAASGGGFISYHFPRVAGGDPLPKGLHIDQASTFPDASAGAASGGLR
jgi:methyl-accepting chemotaxis protein